VPISGTRSKGKKKEGRCLARQVQRFVERKQRRTGKKEEVTTTTKDALYGRKENEREEGRAGVLGV